MLRDGEPITEQDILRVVTAANKYLCDRRLKNKRYRQNQFARELGTITTGRGQTKRVDPQVLSQILSNTYKGTTEPYIRRIDEFLSRERLRSSRLATEPYVEIELARNVLGVIRAAKVNSSIAVIIMEPGQGKTTVARACLKTETSARMITIEEDDGTKYGVIDKLYAALNLAGHERHSLKRRAVKERLRDDRTVIFLVDEAQKLRASGMELIRDLHDNSDSGGEVQIPFVLFGDHDFYRLIKRGRDGGGCPIKPQMTRRMFPIFDSNDPDVNDKPSKRKDLRTYSEQDLIRILRNDKLRIVTDEAIGWLTTLANLKRFGALGTAISVCRLAYTMNHGECLDVPQLLKALRMMLTPDGSKIVIAAIEAARAEPADAAVAASA